MVGKVKLQKIKNYPRPHTIECSWTHSLESSTVNHTTILPVVRHDEGLGAPASYNANPEHASFAASSSSGCYPESRIDNIFQEIHFSLTKDALVTDNIDAVRLAFMPMALAFITDYTAIDELTSEEIQDILELQTESTDRQGYPLYNGAKVVPKFSGSATLNADEPGLTTNQILEGIAFNEGAFYDFLQYKTPAEKLKSLIGGLKWITLTRRNPVARVRIRLRNKTKYMNPYAFQGTLIHVPQSATKQQFTLVTDTTANLPHVSVMTQTRFLEWNQQFDMAKI